MGTPRGDPKDLVSPELTRTPAISSAGGRNLPKGPAGSASATPSCGRIKFFLPPRPAFRLESRRHFGVAGGVGAGERTTPPFFCTSIGRQQSALGQRHLDSLHVRFRENSFPHEPDRFRQDAT